MVTILKKTILFLALIPLLAASYILISYLNTYYSSCFEENMTLKCFGILVSLTIALGTALAITVCPLPGCLWLQHIWFLRQGHPGMRVLTFSLGVLVCMPLNFARPITNFAASAGIIMGIWGFMVDIAWDIDLGLSGIISGILVGTGIFSFAPSTIPTPHKNDDVAWVLPVGVTLGIVLMLSIDWVKRTLVVEHGRIARREELMTSSFETTFASLQNRINEEKRERDRVIQETRRTQKERDDIKKQNMDMDRKIQMMKLRAVEDRKLLDKLGREVVVATDKRTAVVNEWEIMRTNHNALESRSKTNPAEYIQLCKKIRALLQQISEKNIEHARLEEIHDELTNK